MMSHPFLSIRTFTRKIICGGVGWSARIVMEGEAEPSRDGFSAKSTFDKR
jgi:hypothetical protein